jgi:UDP-GlcNAc:undecaprenyl-phosphate/decaprenyl-phosphate GlcNAc-1-phosphate transferase
MEQKVFLLATISILVTFALTPIIRGIFCKLNIVDEPEARKVHKKTVPYGGGLAIYLSFLSICFLFFPRVLEHWGLFLGSFIIILLGIVDDKYGLKAIPKLVIQILVALIVVSSGITINIGTILGIPDIAWLSSLITVFWIVGIVNAINVIDGLDGLAGGVSFIAAMTIGFVSYINDDNLVAGASLILAFSILGFLPHNFSKEKKIFMGDTGSMFLGYSLAVLSIMSSVKVATLFSMIIPIAILIIPIFDMSFAIARRLIDKKHIFHGDREHLHHKLLDLGFSSNSAVMVIYAICLLFSVVAIVSTLYADKMTGYLLLGLSLILIFIFEGYLIFQHQLNGKK